MGSCCSCLNEEDGQSLPLLGSSKPRFERVPQSLPGAPTDKKWYHAKITDEEADRRLRQGSKGHSGSYIVYDNPHKHGQYVLLVIHNRNLHRWRITFRESDRKYVLGDDLNPSVPGYSSVDELVKTHRGLKGKPLKTDSGVTLKLSKDYVYVA